MNRALAPDVVLGVRPVVDGTGALRIGEEGQEPVVDWVVVMRRFDEDHTMASRLRDGTLRADDVGRVARRIAAFHAATPAAAPEDWPAETAAVWRRNLDELEAVVSGEEVRLVRAARRFGDAFVQAHRDELALRARGGLVRHGHGDLRAEHVLVEGDEVTIVDRLEFDPALRRVDVGDDLAFLVMDLEALGAPQVAAGSSPPTAPPGATRATTSCWRSSPPTARTCARRWRSCAGRRPCRAPIGCSRWPSGSCGVRADRSSSSSAGRRPAARAASPRSSHGAAGCPSCPRTASARSSWASRRRPPLRPRPTDSGSAARCTPSSAAEPAAARAVIVDATFGEAPLREAFLRELGAGGADRVRVVECHAPPEVLAARAAARPARGRDASDAGPEATIRLAAVFTPFALPANRRLVVDAQQDAGMLATRCAAWLAPTRSGHALEERAGGVGEHGSQSSDEEGLQGGSPPSLVDEA